MMKKFLFMCIMLATVMALASAASAERDFKAADLKKMSTFLSNFTELGFFDFDAKELTNPDSPGDMIRFGIEHNYVNNYKSRIAPCKIKDCPYGGLVIEGKYVRESIKKYFDYDYKNLVSSEEADPPFHYDGKLYHFHGSGGEGSYFARVDKAVRNASGQIIMTGELYNADDEDDILGTFEALAKPHKFGGKDTWAILSMKSKMKRQTQ